MWIRSGSCPPERCQGQCCKHVALWLDSDPAITQWLSARGLTQMESGGRVLVDFPQTCPHLTDQNLCDLYNLPSRPDLCVEWPTEPSQILLDDCGFTFEWAEDELPLGASA